MKPELLAKLAEHAIWEIRAKDAVTDFNDIPELKAANDEYEAMMTPITAKALEADGWEDYGGGQWYHEKLGHSILDGRAGWWMSIDIDSVSLKGLETMYDLRELMRIVGGAK